jgi:hypothetical protein
MIICIYERTRLWARFILINKINAKDILEIKYPMLALMQIKIICKTGVYNWSVPSSEVTKCDTNTSPRRLVTHLLQQVDQSFTSRKHRGHGSANATRNNTNANDHTTIAKASKASSEYHTMESLCGGPGYTGTVRCRVATYSTSSGTKSGSSSEKQLVKQGWAQMYSTSSTPPTEGLISRSCTWYI